jgi:arabinofuranosyltransferase
MKEIIGGMLLAAAIALFGFAVYNTAWVSDDAYISFRSVDNLVNGHGPTWNTTERVQNFTNPLWVGLNAIPYAVVNDPEKMYFVALGVSALVSILAVLMLAFGAASGPAVAVFAVVALTCSRAYVDYATSGLENPMNHLLLAVFMLFCARMRWSYPVLFAMALCAGLSMVNRMDTILIYAPVLAYAWLAERNLRATLTLAAGFLPFIAWEAFSIIYYGFPFPNTAYAKLGTGIGSAETTLQGLWYLANSWRVDPLTLVLIATGLVGVPFLLRQGRYTALALGGLLYVAYVVKVGGDFMQGRFLTPPLFVAILLIAQLPGGTRWPRWIAATALAVLIAASTPNLPLLTDRTYAGSRGFKDEHGVGDERKYYMYETGLKFYVAGKDWPDNEWASVGKARRAAWRYQRNTHGAVGFRGFFSGPKCHIIDYYALSDPLLARLPAYYHPTWRIGHFARHVPDWYVKHITALTDTLEKRQGEGPPATLAEISADYATPKLALPTPAEVDAVATTDVDNDPNLKAYYDRLELIIRGPLWSKDRWKAIWDINLGRYDYLIDRDAYRYPKMRVLDLDKLSTPKAEGSNWNAPGNQTIGASGIEIRLPETRHNALIEISLDSDDSYDLLYVSNDHVIAKERLVPDETPRRGLWVRQVTVPNTAIRQGYDKLRIFRFGSDKRASIGHITLK